jgi:hypothetical protein
MMRNVALLGLLAGAPAMIAIPALPCEAAQALRVERLDRAAAVLTEPFTTVAGLRELSDGRVLVSDMTEVRVRLADFATGRSADVGRVGPGPGEFERPNALYPGRADTTYQLDLRGRRLLTISPDGRPTERETRLAMVSGGFRPPRGMDDRGRLYLDLAGILAPGLERGATLGRVGVLRLDPRTGGIDSVAEIRVPPMAPPGGTGVRPNPPYRSEDAWALGGAGRVAVVRHDPYRVEWFEDNRPIATGPVVEWTPVRVGRAEREAWLDRLAASAGAVVTQGNSRSVVRPQRPDADLLDWPDALPPFEGPAWITGTGELWIRRYRPASQPRPLYDVFDSRGRPVRQVELPAGRRIVGTGQRSIYAVRTDDDGLLWLERYDV